MAKIAPLAVGSTLEALRTLPGQLTRALGTGPAVKEFLLGDSGEEEKEQVFDAQSSCIAQIRYKDDVITVVFHRGGSLVYTYPGDRKLYDAFISAPSKGAFFNQHFSK